MLRASAMTTHTEIDIQGINGDASAAGKGVEYGAELMQLGEAVANRDEAALKTARQQLVDLAGAAVLVDAAGVAANFQRMVRIADAMGIPIDDMTTDLGQQVREELELNKFDTAQHSAVDV